MTDEERKEVESKWVDFIFSRVNKPVPSDKELWEAGYAAACEAKRAEAKYFGNKYHDALAEWRDDIAAERARSAKFYEAARDYITLMMHIYGGDWTTLDAPIVERFQKLIAEHEASRD